MTLPVARFSRFTQRLLLAIAVSLTVAAPVVGLHAQANDVNTTPRLADTWQGTLHAGQDLRTVVKITKGDDGGYKAVFYSIDQGGDPLPVSKITLEGSTVKMSITVVGGSYEGKLSPDGKTITGSWTQGSPLPLVLTRATPETEWTIPPPRPKLPPMAENADPNFEVATIKPNASGAPSMQQLTINGRNFKTVNSSLGDLIKFSYEVQAKQIVGGPDWLDSYRFDIAAVPEQEGVPNPEQVRIMIRKLLADRFKLTFHHDKRELAAYLLTVGKNGSKIKPTEATGQLPGFGFRPGKNGVTLIARNAAINDFDGFLQVLVLDRPVVDQTGLKGKYDFEVTFTPDDSQFNGHPPGPPRGDPANTAQTDTAAAAPSLYDAFQQELGLKLTPEKAPVDVLVFDHVEKPSDN